MTQEEKEKLAKDNEAISTEEIKQDIFDTWCEIKKYEVDLPFFAKSKLLQGKQMQIKERKDFIEKLEAILEIRGELKERVIYE